MAHELSNRVTGQEITGQVENAADAAMFYVSDEVPWHKLGVAVPDKLTAKEAIIACGGDYEVKLAPVYDEDMNQIVYERDEDGVPCNFPRRLYRADNSESLAIVGNDFCPIQNWDAFSAMDAIVAQGAANYVSAGVLGRGEKLFITMKLPKDIIIAGDHVVAYFHGLNAHDGTNAFTLYDGMFRQVCANTVRMAWGAAKTRYKIYHKKNWEQHLAEARNVLGFMLKSTKTFEETANLLLNTAFDEVMFGSLVDDLFPEPKEGASKKAFTAWRSSQEGLHDAYAKSDLSNIRETAWGAWNAITDYHDHGRTNRGDEVRRNTNRFLTTFERTAWKDEALDRIIDTTGIKADILAIQKA